MDLVVDDVSVECFECVGTDDVASSPASSLVDR